jgi:hypothetical protein
MPESYSNIGRRLPSSTPRTSTPSACASSTAWSRRASRSGAGAEGHALPLDPFQDQEQSGDHSLEQLEVHRLQERLDLQQQCLQFGRLQILE